MMRHFCLCSLITAMLGVDGLAAHGEPPLPDGRRLRAVMDDNFPDGRVLIGATTGSWAFGSDIGRILDREFGYVTPENDFKHAAVRRNPGEWNWKAADAWLEHVANNEQVVRIHAPMGPQCSRWAKQDERTGEELEAELREFMTRLCRRYNDVERCRYLDVVNETVVRGKWHKDRLGDQHWECPWIKMGREDDADRTPRYIGIAFEIADRHASNLKLLFNHHEGPENDRSWQLIRATIERLREQGLRVDAIGWQAHVNVGWQTPKNLAALKALIDWAHKNSLEFHVTEASVWLPREADRSDYQAQADTYRAILAALLEHRAGGIVGWNTWHVSDRNTWQREKHPALFDAECRPKPAYYAIQRELERY